MQIPCLKNIFFRFFSSPIFFHSLFLLMFFLWHLVKNIIMRSCFLIEFILLLFLFFSFQQQHLQLFSLLKKKSLALREYNNDGGFLCVQHEQNSQHNVHAITSEITTTFYISLTMDFSISFILILSLLHS